MSKIIEKDLFGVLKKAISDGSSIDFYKKGIYKGSLVPPKDENKLSIKEKIELLDSFEFRDDGETSCLWIYCDNDNVFVIEFDYYEVKNENKGNN